ncbi:RHS repeat-associated core domain-containing protein, partial [Comamonas sp. MYb21]|uniref:RHS repeat-associated core domain-containing protein n=1 Tax=Comamonas sp. MYb21 TaxID=1848648 RepID=UPI0030A6A8D2
QHNIAIQAMPPDVQRFMYEQFQELEQTVTSQREEAAQSIEIRHYLCDHLGTPHALIREDTQLEWAVQLDAWGNVRAEHNPSGLYQPIRLPGQHADGDTGLYYNRYRYYEQQTGRYINQDPIGLKGGLNVLMYGECNPLTLVDPYGLQAIMLPPPPIPFPIGGVNSGGFPRDPDDIRPPSGGVIVPPPGINWPPSNEDLGCRIEVPPTPAPKAPKPDCETQADICWKIAPTFMSKMWCMMGYLACKKMFKGNDGH